MAPGKALRLPCYNLNPLTQRCQTNGQHTSFQGRWHAKKSLNLSVLYRYSFWIALSSYKTSAMCERVIAKTICLPPLLRLSSFSFKLSSFSAFLSARSYVWNSWQLNPSACGTSGRRRCRGRERRLFSILTPTLTGCTGRKLARGF